MDTQQEENLIAYALGILDGEEERELSRTVAANPALREQVLAFQRDAHSLALLAPPVAPPPALKQQLMARIATPPGRRAGASAERRPVLAWALALSLVAALGLGGWNVKLRSDVAALRAENSILAKTLDTERQTRTVLNEQLEAQNKAVRFLAGATTTERALAPTPDAPKARGTMYMQPGTVTAVLIIDGLPPLTPDRTYQFWLARDGKPVPSAIFNVDPSGHAQIVVTATSQVNDFQEVMVTIEPAAGSQQPTDGTVVLSGKL
ncbi:MAG TPA: anti-sigma factor [Herpetosiphonaceae bacterium]